MKIHHQYYDLYFTTATILEWKYLLQNDIFKDIIVNSLQFLVNERRASIYSFVIMPNHIHLVWYIHPEYTLSNVQASLLSYTAHQFRKMLLQEDPILLESFKVNLSDRVYQFWERNPLSIEIYYEQVYEQKVNYIHNNPCLEKWRLVDSPEKYKYSSAYMVDDKLYWDFLAPK
jgi:REP element-mobilizing transposase RayT